jgi:hypothetical protein
MNENIGDYKIHRNHIIYRNEKDPNSIIPYAIVGDPKNI